MKQILLLALAFSTLSFAAGGHVKLDEHRTDLYDVASLQRGAKIYMNYCMGCHSLKHARYNRVAKDLHIPEELMQSELNFSGGKIGALMHTSMTEADAKTWFGAAPPDLTLVARVRRPDWLYTYLRSFYVDPSRPWGVNNTVFKDVGMPHVLADLQGVQKLGKAPVEVGVDTLTGLPITEEKDHVLYIAEKGKLDKKGYDKLVYDLVNFLVYVAEPVALQRQTIGWWALLFLVILFIPAYFLNKEFWRDVT